MARGDIPTYDGSQFPPIHSPADPEEYSWRVNLDEEQSLKLVDDHRAEVVWEDGHVGFQISASAAHDTEGTEVPTSLAVHEPDVITFLVHHRAGNPLAAGAPFAYPITAGAGWEGGIHTWVVLLPPGQGPETEICRVPRLRNKTLKAARRSLRDAGCKLGVVARRRGVAAREGRVVRQNPRPGTKRAAGTAVNVTLID